MRGLRKTTSKIINKWLFAASEHAFAWRHSMIRRIKPGIRVEVEWEPETELYRATEGERKIMVARTSRIRQQWGGITTRQRILRQEYHVVDGLVRPGDLVIDCGANIGELAICFAEAGAEVIAFEPDPTEFRALSRNAELFGNIHAHNKALWNETGMVEFYEANESGDSSVIRPLEFDSIIQVEAIRLDAFDFGSLTDRPIRLVKLEAEGAEPEIIDGMGDILDRIAFLTVDMGPERGLKKESTRKDVTERLSARGFRMVEFYDPRQTGLFASADTAWPLA